MDEVIMYGCFVELTSDMLTWEPPSQGCFNCKRAECCEIYEYLNDDARRMHLPCKRWEKQE